MRRLQNALTYSELQSSTVTHLKERGRVKTARVGTFGLLKAQASTGMLASHPYVKI